MKKLVANVLHGKVMKKFLLLGTFCCAISILFIFENSVRYFQVQCFLEKNTIERSPIAAEDLQLLRHPFYERFNLTANEKKKQVSLLLIVSSAPHRNDRRMAIRKTWWQDCRSNYGKTVECIFMTDNVQPSHKMFESIRNESKLYKDIHMQNLEGGFVFGNRMIYHMLFAMLNYEFNYFLRMDDDYFTCAEKLIYELPGTSLKRFHWGWVHKPLPKSIRRPEESMIMLSRDVISTFLSQSFSTLYCHPLADQMIMVWSHKLGLNNIYRHDSRLHHEPIFSASPNIQSDKQICHNYIGIHGVYSKDMIHLWENRGTGKLVYNRTLYDNSAPIDMPDEFCWSCLFPTWRFEPRLCIEDYKWKTSHHGSGSYGGREDGYG